MRDEHVQVSVDAAASLSLVFIWGSGRHWSDFKSLGKCPDLHKSFCVERHEWSRSWPDLFFLAKTLPSKHKGGSWGLSVLPREHRV